MSVDYRSAIAGELDRDRAIVTDPRLYAPDGTPWCSFAGGSLWCVNGDDCRNPRHRTPVTEPQEAKPR